MPASSNTYAKPDFWARSAKQLGYPARSVFKLKEINQKHKLFKPGFRVFDAGCSPGSWSLFAAEQVGKNGFVLGLDLRSVTQPFPDHVKILQGDIFAYKYSPAELASFDVFLSDMAPSTTGDTQHDAEASAELCEQALGLSLQLLRPPGTLLMKIFQGPGFTEVLALTKRHFQQVACIKPKSCRSESVETFVLARALKTVVNTSPSAKLVHPASRFRPLATANRPIPSNPSNDYLAQSSAANPSASRTS
jgi:23S rRNA (uridine2552-2'-O)-methyltransferase